MRLLIDPEPLLPSTPAQRPEALVHHNSATKTTVGCLSADPVAAATRELLLIRAADHNLLAMRSADYRCAGRPVDDDTTVRLAAPPDGGPLVEASPGTDFTRLKPTGAGWITLP